MKKLMTILVISGLTLTLFAQSPQKMSYQAVIRNASGALVTNHAVGMRVSILQGSATGTVVYRETYSPVLQTNANGLVTVEIGSGTPSTGTFSGINWGAGPYYIKTETDPNGGSSYTIIGTSQLLSVPYALNSKISESVADNSVTSAKIVDGTIISSDIGNNAINSTKIQDGSVVTADLADHTVSTDKLGNLAVSTEKIQNTSVTADKLSAMGATSGQVLRWNGTAWEPAIDGLSLPFTGSSNTGTYGIRIEHTNDQNRDSYAGEFHSHSPARYGVGVYGTGGKGGYFVSEISGGTGVVGKATATDVLLNWGGYFESRSSLGRGVQGSAIATSGSTIGGYFSSESPSGIGVYGFTSSTSGVNWGGFFESKSTSGYGVFSEGVKFAVYGESSGAQGRAVTGEATGTESIGVRGIALADNSTGVWGEGSNYDFYANGPGTNYGSPSSIRWKENIEVIANPLEMIKGLRGVYFDWNAEHGGIHDIGFIAEEVGKIVPEIVVYEENGIDASGLDYSKITPLLLEAVKAQQEEIEQLKARLEKLEGKAGE